MNLEKMLTNVDANPLPEELREFVSRVLDGRIKAFVLVAEEDDGGIADQICLDLNDSNSNVYALLGGIEGMKRDLLRLAVESRVSYRDSEGSDED